MCPQTIEKIAIEQVRENTERVERYQRVRQARAAAQPAGGRARVRTLVTIFRPRPAMPHAAAPALRFPR